MWASTVPLQRSGPTVIERDAKLQAKIDRATAAATARVLRPWYRKRRIWLAAALGLVAVGILTERDDEPAFNSLGGESSQAIDRADVAPEAETTDDGLGGTETRGQENARKKAAQYLDLMAFSRSGLIKQLEFEGFSNGDARYGVDAIGADWYAQATKKAEEYLALMAFSRQGLIDQLVFDGFELAEAEYGVDASGL